MKVSAVIPAYNRREYLPRAIDSALAQTVPVDEIVVIDDGSTDGSAQFVESRYGDKVRVVRQMNAGVSGARHRGIREARGEWIAFLDSDDQWLPERNAELLQATERVPAEVAWVFGALRVVTDSGEGPTLFEEHGLTINESLRVFSNSIAIQYPYQFPMVQASFIRRSALLEMDCFREGLRNDEDFLASCQIATRYKFAAIPGVVGKYFRTSDLAASSLMMNSNFGADYYRARMLAFEQLAQNGERRQWNRRYAAAARGYYQVLARRGEFSRSIAWQQFRHGGVTPKGVAFFCAAVLGPSALRAWDKAAELFRQRLRRAKLVKTQQNSFRAHLGSLGKSG